MTAVIAIQADLTPNAVAGLAFFLIGLVAWLVSRQPLAEIRDIYRSGSGGVRQRAKDLGLSLVPVDEKFASNTVTAVWWPEGVDGKAISKRAREEFGVVLGGAVQDFVILFCSMRRNGKSLGQMVKEELNNPAGYVAMLMYSVANFMVIDHRGAVNTVAHMNRLFDVGEGDRG